MTDFKAPEPEFVKLQGAQESIPTYGQVGQYDK